MPMVLPVRPVSIIDSNIIIIVVLCNVLWKLMKIVVLRNVLLVIRVVKIVLGEAVVKIVRIICIRIVVRSFVRRIV